MKQPKLHLRDPRYPNHDWPACGRTLSPVTLVGEGEVTCGLCLRVMKARSHPADLQTQADLLALAVANAQERLAEFRADMILAGIHVGINGVCATCGCPWQECPHAG